MSQPASAPSVHPLRIGIAGAGAVGCALATMLGQAGQTVSLLARGATLQAVQTNGVQLQRHDQTLQARVNASDNAQALGPQDLLFLCAKAHDLPALAQAAQPMIGPHTHILPMVNGVPWWYFEGLTERLSAPHVQAVDPDGQLLRLLPTQQVVGVVQFLAAERLAPGVAVSHNPMLLIVGELNHTDSTRCQDIVGMLHNSGIEGRASAQIRDPLWTKIIANLTTNPLSVLTGATLDALYSDPRLLPTTRKILHEGLALAAAYGARIPFDPPTIEAETVAMGPIRTSMLQDALQGNPLELAAIGDAVLELARLQGIPMPTTQDIIALAHYRGSQQSAYAAP